jgi:hypothetical protein
MALGPFSGHGLLNLLPPSYFPRLKLRFRDKSKFYRVGLSAPRLIPNLEDLVITFIWVMTLDLFGVGAPARSYATAGIALRIL